MARVNLNAVYDVNKEISVGEVKPGNVVLLMTRQEGSARIESYIVNKVGNTALTIDHDFKDVLLTNSETGRIILKRKDDLCVVVSGILDVNDYNGENYNV